MTDTALREGEYLERGRRKLKNVEINPGRLCNNKCIFCMSGEERDDHEPWANPERMKAEMRMHYEKGARSVGFLGGEPTAYPHILECLSYAKELGYQRIVLCTNGMRLANRDFMDEALAAGLTRVTVSLHSHVPEIEEKLVGVPGILDKKLAALANLIKAKRAGRLPDNVSVNPVLNALNAPHLESYVRFLAARGVDDFRFNFIWPESRVKDDKTIVPLFRDVVPHVLNLILKNERELKLSVSFGAIPYCVLPQAVRERWPLLEKYFYEEGNDLPTEVSFLKPDADGRVERFKWHERGRFDYRAKVEACRSCSLEPRCMGIYRSYLELYGASEFQSGSLAADRS